MRQRKINKVNDLYSAQIVISARIADTFLAMTLLLGSNELRSRVNLAFILGLQTFIKVLAFL